MFYPQIEENNNSRSLINAWYGYNHTYRTNPGEFFDMENMSTELFPVGSVRKVRCKLTDLDDESMRGIIQVDNDVYVLYDRYLWNLSTDVQTDIEDIMGDDWESEQTLLMMGSYLAMFPLNAYINLNDLEDRGRMESKFTCPTGKEITFTPCNYDGSSLDNLTISDISPEGAKHGDHWLCTNEGEEGTYYYDGYDSMWKPLATSYIKIGIPGVNLSDYFEEGDAVFLNSRISEINNGSVIQKIENDYIVVIGFMKKLTYTDYTSTSWTLEIERKLPTLDYVCTCNNRVWGCHYGIENGEVVNEIYCSKLGDFKNWYVYQGLSTDSFAITVGDMGAFTGCIAFEGNPYFFKERVCYRMYGKIPSEFQIVDKHLEGVQRGSSKSLCIVDNAIFYKGINNVIAFDGANPTVVSAALGNEMYFDGIAGANNNKYYLYCKTDRNKGNIFVYDTLTGLWTKESKEDFIQFTQSVEGQLYAITKNNVYGLGSKNNSIYLRDERVDEEWTSWYAETGEMGYEYPDYKYVSRITLRAYVPSRSEVEVLISYDDRPYDAVGVIRGHDDIGSQSLAFNPFRCDHFKMMLKGHGEVRLYSLAMTTEYGSEE